MMGARTPPKLVILDLWLCLWRCMERIDLKLSRFLQYSLCALQPSHRDNGTAQPPPALAVPTPLIRTPNDALVSEPNLRKNV